MPIFYALFENNLTSDPDDYMARVQPGSAIEMDGVIDRMMQQGSTVTRADVAGTLEDFFSAVENIILEGNNVNTPLANFGASIRGVFTGQDDAFDASRHQITPTTSPGKRLRRAVEGRAQAVKQEAIKPAPNPLEYIDVSSGLRDGSLTPGGMGQLIGHRLKFDPSDPEQGIFFIAEDGSAARAAVVGRNKPADLMFIAPDSLASGDYTVQVRAAFGEDDIRTGELDAVLTVA